MDEQPVRFFRQIGQAVERAVQEHEARCHVPPPNRAPLTAIPFASAKLDDSQLARACEILVTERCDLETVAERLDVPVLVLERHLAEWRPRWRRFLADRASGLG